MGDRTTGSLNRRFTERRNQSGVRQEHCVQQLAFRLTSVALKPIPDIGDPLAAVARPATRNDVGSLGDAAPLDCSHVVPSCSWRRAVSTFALEDFDFDQHFARLKGHGIYLAPTGDRPPTTALSERLVSCVVSARLSVQACPAGASTYFSALDPGSTASTPLEPFRRSRFSLCLRGAGRDAGRGAARQTNVSAAVVAAPVGDERRQRAERSTPTTALLTACSTRDVASVCGATIFGGSHAS